MSERIGVFRYPELPLSDSTVDFQSPWNNLIRALEHRDARADSVSESNEANSTHVTVDITDTLTHSGANAGFFGTTATTQPTALTASDTNTVDGTYGSEEALVINNLRVRLDELEDKLQALGLLA